MYTSLKNFQNVLNQLKQEKLAITCDEGVYRIAREIMLRCHDEFSKLVLCMGSFHMIKVVLGSIGTYLPGSGAEQIWSKSNIFGVNVVQSVLAGSHYIRSLKGMMLLCESLERLRWCEFLKDERVEKYKRELALLQELKESTLEIHSDESKEKLQSFIDISEDLFQEFNEFNTSQKVQNETWAYWDGFICMVHMLMDLIRADREGDWLLHLHALQALLPYFAVCDCKTICAGAPYILRI